MPRTHLSSIAVPLAAGAVGFLAACAGTPQAARAPGVAVASAQPAGHADVVDAVQRLFDGMAAADTAALRAALHPKAQLFVVGSDGGVQAMPAGPWIHSFATARERIVERMWDAKVEVRGDVATLWAPYDLTVDGAFSHCGIDAVQLARTPGGWKPFVVSFTMVATGCPPAPPRR